ncbi:MAG TPA: LptA/OstA family protein [bacterium]|nr:LptA/OstA family protein [bacterium]
MRLRISTVPSLFKAALPLGLGALLGMGPAVPGLAQVGPTRPAPQAAAVAAENPDADSSDPLDTGNRAKISGSKPVNISSNQLSFDRLNGLTLFNGDVKVLHDQLILNSDQLQAAEDNRVASAFGNVKVDDLKSRLHLTCGNLDYHDLMNQITAHDHPVLSAVDEAGHPLTIRARQMELYPQTKEVVAHQDVEILHDSGRSEAQLATFDSKTDQLVLEENPRVFTTQGVIAGRRITTSLSGDHRVVVEGMAEAEFYASPQPLPTKPPGEGTSTPLGFQATSSVPSTAPTPGAGNQGAVRVDRSGPAVTPTPAAPAVVTPTPAAP